MKTSKIKIIVLIIFLFANLTVSFSQGQPDPWTAPPPTFEEDTTDDALPLPINKNICCLMFAGILLAGFSVIKVQKRHKIKQNKSS